MKVVILAGGLPSIIGEANDKIPKPMVEVGGRPLLWHIMKLFSFYDCNDFIICAGFRSDLIKDYFLNYYAYQSDITVHLKSNKVDIHNHITEPWRVSIIDTGLQTATAERLFRIREMVDEDFIVVYGDCVSNINVPSLMESHFSSKKEMTVVLARPTGRNRVMPLDDSGKLLSPVEDTERTDAWANACIMAISPEVLKTPPHAMERFEVETINALSRINQVSVFRHNGFWLPVETVRDRDYMQRIWSKGNAPWHLWKD